MKTTPAAKPFWPVAVLLVAASLVYCAPLLTHLDQWGRGDWDQFVFRYETPRIALLRDHVLPGWNPYASGGTVLLAHPDSPVLSPWYLLVLLLGAPIGLRIQVVVFMAAGAVGMAALARRLGASRAGAVVGGIVFMMSSHFALHIAEGHLEWCALGLMPWLAICVLRLDGLRPVLVGALLLASVLTFGAVYIPAVFVPFFTVWIVLEAIRTRRASGPLRWAAIVVVAALLSSVKLLPMMQFASEYPRAVVPGDQTSRRLVLTGLFDPRQTSLYQADRDRTMPDGDPAKVMPTAIARPVTAFLDSIGEQYWFPEYGCYIGAMGVVLACWGGLRTFGRRWPLYVAGALAGVVVLGAVSYIDLWAALRRLPLYGQLHVPSRFLAAVAFVLAVTSALGLTRIIEDVRPLLRGWRRAVEALAIAVLYGELVVMGWALFSDVFVLPPIASTPHADFAQRVGPRDAARPYPHGMRSALYATLASNSGTLDAYENLAVAPAAVKVVSDPAYRGEAYLERGEAAHIRQWTMSDVTVEIAPDGADRLVLNQNFANGWRAHRRDAHGAISVAAVQPSAEGLISVRVEPGDREVELFYVPPGFATGAWISGFTLGACLLGCGLSRGTTTPAATARRTR